MTFKSYITSQYDIATKNNINKLSKLYKKLIIFCCHITFLKLCKSYDVVPKGLKAKLPIKSKKIETLSHNFGLACIGERLHYYKWNFDKMHKDYALVGATIQKTINTNDFSKNTMP